MKKRQLHYIISLLALTSFTSGAHAESIWSLDPVIDIQSSSVATSGVIASSVGVSTQSITLNEEGIQSLKNSKMGDTFVVPVPEGLITATVNEVRNFTGGAKTIHATYSDDDRTLTVVITLKGNAVFADVEGVADTFQIETTSKGVHLRKESELRTIPNYKEDDFVVPEGMENDPLTMIPSRAVMGVSDDLIVAMDNESNPFEWDDDNDGVVDALEDILGTDKHDAGSVNLGKAQIDVLATYNQSMVDYYGSVDAAESRILQINEQTNIIYDNSGVRMQLNIVGYQQFDINQNLASSKVLSDSLYARNGFEGQTDLLETTGADITIFYRPYNNDGNCGIAYLGGNQTNGDMKGSIGYMKAVVAATCSTYVNGHEVGHLGGLYHSREQDGRGGTFHYSLGHGERDDFVTMMAYTSAYNGRKVNFFSNQGLICQGKMDIDRPCGIDREDTSIGSDAVYTLNVTGHQLSLYNGLDSDGDGLIDQLEEIRGTDPFKEDTDEDGMGDGWEVKYQLDPLDPFDAGMDLDDDGLTNLEESQNGTSPRNPDTDADGLNDGVEVKQYSTNPVLYDSDGDKMSDGYEVNNGFNPNNSSDGELDSDNDGYANWMEGEYGSDPRSSNDYPDKGLTLNLVTPSYGATFDSGEKITFTGQFDGDVDRNSFSGYLESNISGIIGELYDYSSEKDGAEGDSGLSFTVSLPDGDHIITPYAEGRYKTIPGDSVSIKVGALAGFPDVTINESELIEGRLVVSGLEGVPKFISASVQDTEDGDVSNYTKWKLFTVKNELVDTFSGKSVTLPVLSKGEYKLEVTARDRSYNTRILNVTLAIDSLKPIPDDWKQVTWGVNDFESSSEYDSVQETFTLYSVGRGITSRLDQGQFVYKEIKGNFEITARLKSKTGQSIYAAGGIMVRSSLNNDAANVYLHAIDKGVYFQYRKENAYSSSRRTLFSRTAFEPNYLKLVRQGSLITGYTSSTGKEGTWELGYQYRIELNQSSYIGFAGFSKYDDKVVVSEFDKLSVHSLENVLPEIQVVGPVDILGKTGRLLEVSAVASDFEDGDLSESIQWLLDDENIGQGASIDIAPELLTVGGHNLTAFVTDSNGGQASVDRLIKIVDAKATLPDGWSETNIGESSDRNGMMVVDGKYYIEAQGYNYSGRLDSGYFGHQVMEGNFELVMRVDEISPENRYAAIGLMVREDMSVNGKNFYVMATQGVGLKSQYRSVVDGSTRTLKSNTQISNPVWLKLVRTGVNLKAYYATSETPLEWFSLGEVALPMNDSLLVGVASHSRSRSASVNSIVSNYQLTSLSDQPPIILVENPGERSMKEWLSLDLKATAFDPEIGDITADITWAIDSEDNVLPYTGGEVSLTSEHGLTKGLREVIISATDSQGLTSSTTIPVNVYHPGDDLPGRFVMTNVGGGEVDNDARLVGDTWLLSTQSYLATSYNDQVLFIHEEIDGNFDVKVQVNSIEAVSSRTAAGLMVRAGSGKDEQNIYLFETAGYGLTLQARKANGLTTSRLASDSDVKTPEWLRITRTGKFISAYSSPDGVTWTLVKEFELELPQTVLVGMVAHSNYRTKVADIELSGYELTTSPDAAPQISIEGERDVVSKSWVDQEFKAVAYDQEQGDLSSEIKWGLNDADNVIATGSVFTLTSELNLPTGSYTLWTTVTDYAGHKTSVEAFHIVMENMASKLPEEWGYSTLYTNPADNNVTIQGDIWTIKTGNYRATSSRDDISYIYQTISGDFDVSLDVMSIAGTTSYSGVGIMVRNSMDVSSINAFMHQTQSAGARFSYREVTGRSTYTEAYNTKLKSPSVIRMVRKGNVITTYTGEIGSSEWVELGVRQLPLDETVYIGIASQTASRNVYAEMTVSSLKFASAESLKFSSVDIPVRVDDVSLAWKTPGFREDGTPLSVNEIDGYVVTYGNNETQLDNSLYFYGGGITSALLEDLPPGRYFFTIATIDSNSLIGKPSDPLVVDVI